VVARHSINYRTSLVDLVKICSKLEKLLCTWDTVALTRSSTAERAIGLVGETREAMGVVDVKLFTLVKQIQVNSATNFGVRKASSVVDG